MSDAFDTALCRATQLSRQPEQKISIGIQLGMAGGGGLYPLIKRQGGHSVGMPSPLDDDPTAPWAAMSPPPEPQIKHEPIPQDVTVTHSAPGIMQAYFKNLAEGDEEKGYDRLYRKGGGGISSIQKRMNIKGEPHQLAYINSDKASLLRQLGGSGKSVNGIPAYFWDVGDDPSGEDWDVSGLDPGQQSGVDDTSVPDTFERTAQGKKEDEDRYNFFTNLNPFIGSLINLVKDPMQKKEDEGKYGSSQGKQNFLDFLMAPFTRQRKGGGGLSSLQKQININGEPHQLSYINSDEASLLKQLGGSGRNVNGVPAYFGVGYSDADAGYSDPGTSDFGGGETGGWSDQQEADAAATQAAADAAHAAAQQELDAGLEALSFPMSLEEETLRDLEPGYASLPPEVPEDLDFIGPLTAEQALALSTTYFGTPITPEQAAEIQSRVTGARADAAIAGYEKVPTDKAGREEWSRKKQEELARIEPRMTDYKDYEGLTTAQIEEKQRNLEFFTNTDEHGLMTFYGPMGRPDDPEDSFEFWNPNPLSRAFQSGNVYGAGAGAPTTFDDISDTIEAGIPSSAMGILDPEAPESYFHAQQLVLQEMMDAREKEEKELEEENETRRSLGWIELDEPEGGWKTVDPDKHDDPFTTGLYLVSALMRQGIPFLGAINFAQRMSGSGEHGMEIQGIEDKIAGAQALGALTGYHGPSLSRESQEYEKAKEKEWLAGERFAESLPDTQPLTPQQEEQAEAERMKTIEVMAKFLAAEDDEEQDKVLKNFTEAEYALLKKAYPTIREKGIPSLIDQIG